MKKFFLSIMLPLTLIGCGKEKAKSLIVYTNSGSHGRAEYLTELAKKNGFDINIVFGGGTDIANRLLAEKNNPIADVIFGLNPIEFEKLKEENVLVKFKPNWADSIPSGLSDKENYYNAVTVTPLVAIYNPNIIKGEDIPKDWTDLAIKDKYTGKYNLFGLDGGTSKTILASIVSRYKDTNGTLNISQEGWDITKKYVQNGYVQKSEEDWFGNLISGKRPITMIWGSGISEREKANNFNVGVMTPKIGVPYVVEQLAIVNGSKKLDMSKKFINWLGSPEIQTQWAKEYGTAPAHPKALENSPEDVKNLVNKLKIQELDWTFITKNIDSWVEKVELEYNK